jgi:hypothetical protein
MTKDQVRSTEEAISTERALDLALEALATEEYRLRQIGQSQVYPGIGFAITAIKQARSAPYVASPLVQSAEERSSVERGEPVAHCTVRPLRGDESYPKTEIIWVKGKPIAGPLYTTPPNVATPLAAQPAYTKDDVERAFSAGLVEGEKLAIETPAAQRQCNWPTCQSEEYQRALAEQIKQELVTGAAQRPWVGLTDEEIDKTRFAIQTKAITQRDHELSRAIEAKLRSKNNG